MLALALTLAGAAPAVAEDPGFTTGLWTRDTLLGDPGGVRTALGNLGLSFDLTDINEVLGNVSGGIQRGAAYDGLTTMTLTLDTAKAFGWAGGSFNVSALQIRGRSLSADNLLNLQTVSGISALPSTRLWELWYQQQFHDGRLDVKVGQQSVDQEYMTSEGSALFLNTMMGWPMLPSADLYAGGPAYPLASLGARLRVRPTGDITILAGVFNDNPPGGRFDDDSQVRGAAKSGTSFNTNTGALFLAEVQYALNQPADGDLVRPGARPGLPGTYKLGVWFDTAAFPSPRTDNTGRSLADPASNGTPRLLRNNWSLYAVLDQTIWRPDPEAARAVGIFARAMGAPGDRNLIDFSFNGGITLKAPLPGRDDDTLGLGYGIASVGSAARGLDRDTGSFSGSYYPVRSTESFIELTYQAQVTPWFQLQPDVQYIIVPGAGLPSPTNPARRIGNEAVFGLRSMITF